ncbi:MAG: pentapeptide repeat-containing protein [Fusobacteriaceae bacterium]
MEEEKVRERYVPVGKERDELSGSHKLIEEKCKNNWGIEKFEYERKFSGEHYDRIILPEAVCREVRRLVVENITDFSDVTFDGEVDFSRSPFFKYTKFTRTCFKEKAKFSDVKFKKVDFIGASFKKNVEFNKASYFVASSSSKDSSDYGHTIFEEKADFSSATFSGDVDFSNVTFESNVNFFGTIFNDDANFFHANFQNDAMFFQATFRCQAYFYLASFYGDADFLKAIFKKSANFSSANFKSNANFNEAYFAAYDGAEKSVANFSETLFEKYLYFNIDKVEELKLDNIRYKVENGFLIMRDEIYDRIEKANRKTWRTLKYLAIQIHDEILANKMSKKEIESYRNELKEGKNYSEGIILWFNKISNNDGLSWMQAVLFTLKTSVVLFLLSQLVLISDIDNFWHNGFTWYDVIEQVHNTLTDYIKSLSPLAEIQSKNFFNAVFSLLEKMLVYLGTYKTIRAIKRFDPQW